MYEQIDQMSWDEARFSRKTPSRTARRSHEIYHTKPRKKKSVPDSNVTAVASVSYMKQVSRGMINESDRHTVTVVG